MTAGDSRVFAQGQAEAFLPARRVAGFGQSVIREMTRLAEQHDAVNLSQGFPDFAAPSEVEDAAIAAIRQDLNQYAVTWGAPNLRRAIAASYAARGWTGIDPEREVTVACGATETITAAALALVEEGSEVLVFEPLHESYAPRFAFPKRAETLDVAGTRLVDAARSLGVPPPPVFAQRRPGVERGSTQERP